MGRTGKGETWYAIKALAECIEEIGDKRIIRKSDGAGDPQVEGRGKEGDRD